MTERSSHARRAKLAWRCRRGMRELDLLLADFLSADLEKLGDEDLTRLETLLEHADQDILAWLVSEEVPGDPELRPIVERIRRAIA